MPATSSRQPASPATPAAMEAHRHTRTHTPTHTHTPMPTPSASSSLSRTKHSLLREPIYTHYHRCRRRRRAPPAGSAHHLHPPAAWPRARARDRPLHPSPKPSHSLGSSLGLNLNLSRNLNLLAVCRTLLLAALLALGLTPAVAEHVRELEVSEGVPVGHQIGFIGEFSHGVDSGPPYLIVPVPGSSVDSDLAIDQTTGEIRTKVRLDRETRASYSLVAIPLSGENVRVVVRVLDENDNAPTFPQPVMHIEFPENTPRDVKRTLQPARDLDLERYNTQRYNILAGNVDNAFRLSSHRERDGVLYLDLQINGFLDRETTPAYSLVIEALDGGSPPLRGQMTVNISIQDVNDNQPIFNQSRYFATIPENATLGTSVLQVYASDTDAGENGLVEYAINRRQSDKEQMFRIDARTGLISVNKPLDFETKELHELVVVAKDHGEQPLETTAFVSIRVTDVNDNQPTIQVIFLSDDATPKISEAAQPGEFVARISVNDPDSKTEYSNVNVTLDGGDGRFGLTTRDNIIYLVIVSLPLDREAQPNYTLSVVATDNGNPPLHAAKTIHLRVTDVNDNAPEFERELYHANVMEVADPGTSVLQVVARDRDEGDNSAVVYALAETPETHSQWFQVDPHTGLITTRAHIDCETEPVPQLTVVAKDNGHPPLSATATVLVTIHDVNDNEPIFDQSFYNVSVAENEPVGRCILKVSASDPDCGVNAMVNYTLGEGLKHLTQFEVRPASGEICIAGDLDFDRRSSYEFPVIATDRGGLSTTAMVKIQLTDVNDNRPVFYPREYNVSLRESAGSAATATPIVSVVATDPDSGRFGAVSYRIVAGNEAGIFRIDRATGEIFINRPSMLSVRSQPIHVLNISASDGGGLRTSLDAVVFLSIIDSTQRPPIFEKPRYNYHVKEDVPRGTVVGAVLASSSDSGSRGVVRYSIYSGDPEGFFSIDPVTGNIRIASPLDHEAKPQVLLNIQATSGDPPAYGHTQVNIDIEDVNDNPPEFETSLVRISVPENVDLGTPLYAAHAQDKDSGKSGEVTYSLTMLPSQPPAALAGNLSAHLMSSLLLPHQQQPHQQHRRHQQQQQQLQQFGGAVATPYSRLYRSEQPGSTAMAVVGPAAAAVATRPTGAVELQPSKSGAASELFAIDARSGHLTLSRHLDYETSQRHSLIVTATDSGEPPLSANLTILVEVQDVNDNPPVFDRPEYSIKVLESMPINSQILQVTANDLDTGNNARITYRIVGSNFSAAPPPASSSGKSPTKIPLPGGPTAAAATAASSATAGLDAEITQLFGIFPNSGWIYLRGALDRESRDRYELTVMASDNGTPSAHARTRIVVNVLDANDNDPQFLRPAYEFAIEENMRRGSLVGVIGASDLDLAENAAVRYSLIPSNTSFQVNPVTGEIVTREPLDREARPLYDLVAEARDQGSPHRSARVPVKVRVTDVNDNAPDIVDPQEDVVSVREEQPPGTEVVRIRAVDRDNGHNASITYSILKGRDSDGYGLFAIDASSGVIRTRVVLDHEERSIYRLAVAATDGGNPPKQSIRLLRVEVLDLNDNRPTFTSSSLVFRVREDVPVGHVVGSVGPTDRADNWLKAPRSNDIAHGNRSGDAENDDDDDEFDVTYTLTALTQDAIEGAFDIDRQTGLLVVARRLDRELQAEFRLEIRALDTSASNNPQSSAITVKVEIADVNDNPPRWPADPVELRVREDAPVGSAVHNFTASDADTGTNGDLQYRLLRYSPVRLADDDDGADGHGESVGEGEGEGTAAPPLFAVDPLTGALSLLAPLDHELVREYILIVQALDQSSNVTERLQTAVTARLLVEDVNDNAPRFVAPLDLTPPPATTTATRSLAPNTPNPANAATPAPAPASARIHLSDATRVGDPVTRVVAVDADAGDNGRVAYAIASGNADGRFRIDTRTGLIELAQPLPPAHRAGSAATTTSMESQTRFNLVISASDHGQPTARQSLLHLQVLVRGTHSQPPRFLQDVYEASIAENTQSGSFVLQVEAKSFSGGDHANLTFEIPSGVADNHFIVDTYRGIVSTRGQFDRETRAQYTLPIYVYDTNRAAAAVAGDGRQQHSPSSSSSVGAGAGAAAKPVTSTSKSTSTATTKAKTATTATSTSSAASATTTTTASTATALSGGSEMSAALNGGQFDIATLIITITDINDHAPEFRPGSCYPLAVPENSDLAVVHTVVATDLDEGANGEIVYSIIGGNLGNKFSIDMHSGELTARSLDREQHSRYLLQIQAQDRGSPITYQGHCNISVMVEDQNDNDPRFEQSKYAASVAEDLAVGSSVLRVRATDADLGLNARLVYSLANESQWLFAIDNKSGLITTVGPLDRERQHVYSFQVVATDGGRYDARSARVPVQIVVEDVNDNRPVFERYPFRAQVPALIQPGQTLLQVGAVDVDQGINGEILYSLPPVAATGAGHVDAALLRKFRINPNTGVVSATQSLAGEAGRLLHLEVVARDKGNPPQSARGLIELRVGDAPPGAAQLRFQNETYRVRLRENAAPGQPVLQVGAVRSDGRRQRIVYAIGAGNEDGAFEIDAASGSIRVRDARQLDYERFAGAANPLAGGRARALSYEEEAEAAPMADETNQDADGDDDSKSQGSDAAKSRRSHRELTATTTTAHELAPGTRQPHELRLVVVARTEASPSAASGPTPASPSTLYGYAEVLVELEDENDNAPQFTQRQYSATVWEGNNKGALVIQVAAFDADAGANARLLYHIVDGNHDNAFVIEPAFSGVVKTNIVLDREIRDLYRLKVIATDEGVPQMTGTATIRVHIVDVNDNQPTFPPHSVISVSEGTELGSVVASMSANDVDTHPALTYRLDGGPLQGARPDPSFAIDRYSGKLILRRRLDYERRQEYQLEVVASDAAHEARTTLTVRVADENDNAPLFQAQRPPAYFALLPDAAQSPLPALAGGEASLDPTTNSGSGEVELLTVNATDSDAEGRNSAVRYSLQPPAPPGFRVDERSGRVLVNASRALAALAGVGGDVFLTIVAQDEGAPPLRSSTVLRVRSSAPGGGRAQFLQSQYRAQINEAAPLGSVVLRLTQDVLDAPSAARAEAGALAFSIVSGNEDGAFEVHQATGQPALVLARPLDRERVDRYKLRLVLSDGRAEATATPTPTPMETTTAVQTAPETAPADSSAIDVFVSVEDANDNAPRFDPAASYAAEVSEAAPLRHSIAQLRADDADLANSPHSELVYDITSGNDEGMFTVDLLSGVLFVNNRLDYDAGGVRYDLVLRACDSAPLPLCSLQPFRVTLLDENDNEPRFPVAAYVEAVAENEPVGSSVFTARATDLDRGVYGGLNYSIDRQPVGADDVSWKLFRVDPQSGVVTTAAVFDYEQRHRYDFVLRATDAGGRAATVAVRVLIESRDEFAPQFSERTYRLVMPSPSSGYLPLGSVIGRVSASDRDRGPDGRVVYQLSSQHAYFKVNRTTGAVVVRRKLDDSLDDGRDISLVISASSGRPGSLTNMTVVEISLDPLADPGTNLASSGGIGGGHGPGGVARGGLADWLVGLLVAVLLLLCAAAGIFLFVRMRSRRPRHALKQPTLGGEAVGGGGNANSYVDPSAFDTIPIRGGSGRGAAGGAVGGVAGAVGQFAPPKYDEIPPYGPHAASSNSGAATTSELSGSEQSGSSGRGSAEDDGEDEEIRMINEGPLQQRGASGAGGSEDGRMSDLSVQNTQEYLARLGIVDRDRDAGAGLGGVPSSSSRHCSESMGGSSKDPSAHLHHGLPHSHPHAHGHPHPLPMVDSLHMFDEDPAGESDITNLIYAKLNDVTGAASDRGSSADEAATTAGSIGAAVDHVMGFGDVPVVGPGVGVGNVGPSMNGSLSSIVHSEEELTGSYNWDYLLDWGPQYQPLAHVFSEIARLKDDTLSVHSGNSGASSSATAKSKQQQASSGASASSAKPPPPHIPPPLLTNVAPRSINMPVLAAGGAGGSRLPPVALAHHLSSSGGVGVGVGGSTSGPQYMLPRSPISHDAPGGFSTSSAMSPSFSPSLSPLATRSPSISPLGGVGPAGHHMVSLPRHPPQPSQRAKGLVVEQDLRGVRM